MFGAMSSCRESQDRARTMVLGGGSPVIFLEVDQGWPFSVRLDVRHRLCSCLVTVERTARDVQCLD